MSSNKQYETPENSDSGNEITVCPECEHPQIATKSPRGRDQRQRDGEWFCKECGAHFPEPAIRESKHPQETTSGGPLPAKLSAMDPDELSADTAAQAGDRA